MPGLRRSPVVDAEPPVLVQQERLTAKAAGVIQAWRPSADEDEVVVVGVKGAQHGRRAS